MRVIALIDDPAVVRRILEHLGRWAPEPAERGPPVQAPDWPRNAVIPLTYHPVPDIAVAPRILEIYAILMQSALQAGEHWRNILWRSCQAALNQQQIAVIGPTCEKRRE